MRDWLYTSWTAVAAILIGGVIVYFVVIALTRIAGLRSFAKMSSFDFAVTIAIGSVLAATVTSEKPALVKGVVALATLYFLKAGIARLRQKSRFVRLLVDNRPLLLMAGPEVIEENLRKANISREDLNAKLREANVIHPSRVRAVVAETTGDISVLHGTDRDPPLDLGLLDGVRGVERLQEEPPSGSSP